MINKIITIIATFFLITNSYSQKIKGDFLNVERIIRPKFNIGESNIDMVMKTTSTDPYFTGNLNHNYDLFSDFYFSNAKFSNNFGSPKYIALIDFKYKEPSINLTKKENQKYVVTLNSNIYATLYLIDKAKGVFEVENVNLKEVNLNYPVNNFKNELNSNKLSDENKIKSTLVFDDLSEYEANQMKTTTNSYFKQLNTQQISKIPILAAEYIEKKFFPYSKNIGVYFSYIKPTDEFKGEVFNKAYDLIQKSLTPVNQENLFQAISILKTEKESVLNTDDKKALKYKIAILENTINCFYAMEKYNDSKVYVDELLLLDSKNDIATSVAKKIANPSNIISNDFLYNNIPAEFVKTDLRRFLNKKEGELNQLNKIDGLGNVIYMMSLNNFINCSVEFQKGNNFTKKDNDLMDYLAEAIVYSKNSLNDLPKNAREELVNFSNFVDKVNNDIKQFDKLKATFIYLDESNVNYRDEVRKLLFSKYKRADFLKYNDELKSCLNKVFEKTDETRHKATLNIYDLYSKVVISSINKEYGNKTEIIDRIENLRKSFETKFKNKLPEEYFELNTISNNLKIDKGYSQEELRRFVIICSNIYNQLML